MSILHDEIAKILTREQFPVRPPSTTWGEYCKDRLRRTFIESWGVGLTTEDLEKETGLTADEVKRNLLPLEEGGLIRSEEHFILENKVYYLDLEEDPQKVLEEMDAQRSEIEEENQEDQG